MRKIAGALPFALLCAGIIQGQTIPSTNAATDSIRLTVTKGVPLRVALEKEITVKKLGEQVQGRVVEPVYAFDHLVVPIGSQVLGKIIKIEKVSKGERAQALLNADLTPARGVTIEFDELVLPDGKRRPLHTIVSPGTSQVVHLAAAKEKESEKKGVVSKGMDEARRQINQEWDAGVNQVKSPGKMHRLEHYLIYELPYHPQYVEAGTRYNAELEEPLDFGSESNSEEKMELVGTPPPPDAIVHVLLVTPLSSATSKKDAPVRAVLSEPLFSADHRLILPQGTVLEGVVVQARPARNLKRNGELRINFRTLKLPEGAQRTIDATLDGVEVGRADNMELDAEGGAHSTTSKTRYLSTGISIALAATSAIPDMDEGLHGSGFTGTRAAAGGAGYRLIGIALSLSVHSRVLGVGLGAYGAGLSIYTHFLTRGQDVVFPKNTPMDIGFGGREAGTHKAAGAD